MSQPTVFISYSHLDAKWKERLARHLEVLGMQGLLEVWDDQRLGPGALWQQEICAVIDQAQVAVLLISAAFLTSPFVRVVEIPRCLERRLGEGMHIVPVIVGSCLWQDVAWLAALQVRPPDGRPLASFSGDPVDQKLTVIAREIAALVKTARTSVPARSEEAPAPTREPTEGSEQERDTFRERKGGVWRFDGLSVAGIRILVLRATQEQAVQRRDLSSTYNDIRRDLPAELEALYRERLPRLEHEHRQRGKSYGNDNCYSLDSFRLYRKGQAQGRPWHLELAFSPTDYATFSALNLDLDRPVLRQETGTLSIRDYFAPRLEPEAFDQENLTGIPLHLRMGVNVVLFTSDSQLVLGDRSRHLAIAPGDNTDQYSIHIVGEGMLRPNDEDPGIGAHRPNPFRTAERGVKDELALRAGVHYDPAALRLMGLFFDFKRYQPIAVFVLPLTIDAATVLRVWEGAKDALENRELILLDARAPTDLRSVILDEYVHEGLRGRLPAKCASHHVRTSLLLGLINRFGNEEAHSVFTDCERSFQPR